MRLPTYSRYSIKRLEKELHEAHRRAELQRSARSSKGGMAATTALYENRCVGSARNIASSTQQQRTQRVLNSSALNACTHKDVVCPLAPLTAPAPALI